MPVDDARKRFLESCPRGPLGVEEVALADAFGRILAGDITAPEDLPGFARSTVDGYAVLAADTFGASEGLPAYLRVVDEILMGQDATRALGPGECAVIATGGMLPPNADAAIMVEHTESLAVDEVGVLKPASPGQNVIRRGEDCPAGHLLLAAGRPLRAQELGLLAHAGVVRVPVARQPVCALLTTGDELVDPARVPAPGQIRESNSFTIRALVQEAGGVAHHLGRIPDIAEEIEARLRQAMATADVIMVSGGSSVGTRDLTAELLDKLGRPGILVHGVSLKPGKPTILGVVDGKPVMGLPGHPVSAQVVFGLFARPLLRQLLGLPPWPAYRAAVRARLAKNYASAPGRVDVLRVALTERAGETWAEPVQGKSGLITTLTRADGIVTVPAGTEGLLAGDWVDVELI